MYINRKMGSFFTIYIHCEILITSNVNMLSLNIVNKRTFIMFTKTIIFNQSN